jgi:hypothetical protein
MHDHLFFEKNNKQSFSDLTPRLFPGSGSEPPHLPPFSIAHAI